MPRLKLPEITPSNGAVLAAVTVAALCWVYKQTITRPMPISRQGKTVLPLMPTETSMIMMDAATSISTVSFYKGDHKAAAKFLRGRVAEICRANPWLAGRLDQQSGDKGPVLVFASEAQGDRLPFFHAAPGEIPLSRDTPYDNMAAVVLPILVKNGTKSLGRSDEPQFQVSVVPDAKSPDTRWALVVSMSHVIADGHTFYQVHNMLSDDDARTTVVALTAKRKPFSMETAMRSMGGEVNAGFLGRPKPGLLLSLVTATMAGKMFGPSCAVATYALNDAFVKEQKVKDGNEDVAFVSTNDVITSTICTATQCDVGTMDVNFRGKVEGCEETDAGNYEDKIVYRPADFCTPSMIRRSILSRLNLKRAATPPTILPTSVLDFWRLEMITSVSNWSTFAKDVSLERCGSVAELHLPLFDPTAVPARIFSGCFVFRARPGGALGLALAGSPEKIQAIVESGLLGEKIK